ncbi:hypothetical protein MAR_013050 [Mya arenaria]|uniref:Uncharacterized protein n=1 Tax=Mya arenaria TaxID=6604 RepID=A0ABY7G2R6_MYAAR|nr:hypothetical protein MAR_013050 [Mya arenaria]
MKVKHQLRGKKGKIQKSEEREMKVKHQLREKREDLGVRRKRNERETPAQRKKREDSEVRRKRNESETPAKKERRKPSGHLQTALKAFKTGIQNCPIFICTNCNRMLYRTSLKRYNINNYKGDMLNCSTDKLSHDDIECVCTFCQKSLKQNKLPSLAVNNNLELSEVPYEFDHLNSLKYIFISRRIPFMKLLALLRGKQKAVHGCVVNVPIEPDQVPSADTFITIKLKKKLKYRGHSYINVVLNENWIEDSCNVDPELWGSLVQNNQLFSNHENNEQSTDEDNRSKLSVIPFDSCVQPKDIVDESVLSIAPGEGKIPISVAQDQYAEEMAFPQLFPTGKFGLSHERPTKLSMKKYFQARLLNCDGRFAKNIDYIFYAQYRVDGSKREQDPDLFDLVNLVQTHTHSVACRKHGKTCRFAFPRPPLDETLVLKPLENPPSRAMQEVYSTALTSVSEQLVDVEESTTLQIILDKVKVEKELYLNALHWIKTKSGQPAVLLKRKPVSVNINNYNTTLMRAWEGNIDVQYVTNVYSCVMYLASYVPKPEKTLGDVLRSSLTHREVSAQEAVYRVLSIPLTQGSREVLFVATDMPEDRTRLFKSMEIL